MLGLGAEQSNEFIAVTDGSGHKHFVVVTDEEKSAARSAKGGDARFEDRIGDLFRARGADKCAGDGEQPRRSVRRAARLGHPVELSEQPALEGLPTGCGAPSTAARSWAMISPTYHCRNTRCCGGVSSVRKRCARQ